MGIFGFSFNISGFIKNSIRVLKLTTKPKRDEFTFVAKVTALGIVVIGSVGYIVESIKYLLGG